MPKNKRVMKIFNSFFFRCEVCEDYRTSEETFYEFITLNLIDKLKCKIESGIVNKAILDFGCDCPRCSSLKEFSVNLVIEKTGD
jgi:hypothetical protein